MEGENPIIYEDNYGENPIIFNIEENKNPCRFLQEIIYEIKKEFGI
jgi:hypothetical protein